MFDFDGGHTALIIGSVLSLIGVYVIAVKGLRGQVKAAEIDVGPQWYRELRADIKTLQKDVRRLEVKVDHLEHWRRVARLFIDTLLALIPKEDRPPIPHELREDFPDDRDSSAV